MRMILGVSMNTDSKFNNPVMAAHPLPLHHGGPLAHKRGEMKQTPP